MIPNTKKIIVMCIALIIIVPALIFIFIDRDIPAEALKSKYAGPASKFINVDGVNVHYRDQGKGPAVVCLHGIFASLHTWEGWVKELSGKYRLITIDLPAFGLTGPANFEYNKDNYLLFLNKLINKLGLKDYCIAGNSFGGYLAWNYVVKYPGQVKKIIILDAIGYQQPQPLPLKLITAPFFGYFTKWFMPKFVFAMNVKDVYGNPDNIKKETIDLYYELMMHHGNREAARSLFFELEKVLSADSVDVDRINVPTLIMWGNKDRWVPVESAARYRKDIKNSRLIMYDGAGHIPMEEFPKQSAADADAFLRM